MLCSLEYLACYSTWLPLFCWKIGSSEHLGKLGIGKLRGKSGECKKSGKECEKSHRICFVVEYLYFSVVSVIIMIIIHIVVVVVLKIFLAKLLNLFCRGSGLCHIKSSIDWFLLAQSLSGRDVGL